MTRIVRGPAIAAAGLLLAAAAAPAAASMLASPEARVASRLLIAVPTLDEPAVAAEDAGFAGIRGALAALAAGPPGGYLHSTVEVEVAFGNPYQVLAWLEDGRVDGAVATPLVAHLVEAAHPGRFVRPAWPLLPQPATPGVVRTYAPWARAWRHTGDHRRPVAASEALDTVLFDSLYAAAAEVLDGTVGDGQTPAPHRLIFPSHLSSAAFAAIVSHGSVLLREQLTGVAPEDRARVEEVFWRRVFGLASFDLGGRVREPAMPAAAGDWLEVRIAPDGFAGGDVGDDDGGRAGGWRRLTVPDLYAGDEPLADELLLDQGTIHELLPPSATESPWKLSAVAYFQSKFECTACAPLRAVLADHYGRLGRSNARAFRFTLPEAMALIHEAQQTSGQQALALLLPGGGVKASYQTVLADRLYEEGWLRNALAPAAGPGSPAAAAGGFLPVRYVVGNSGGALLGFFVARLGSGDDRRLSDLLWTRDGHTVDSLDIFSSIDLMRWATALACFVVFCAVLWVMSRRATCPFPGKRPEADEHRRWGLTATLVLLLGTMPLVLKFVKGEAGVEHVPAIEGMFYFAFVFLALGIDNVLVRRDDRSREPGRPRRPRNGAVLLTCAGAAVALLPVVLRGAALLRPVRYGRWTEWLEAPLRFSATWKLSLLVGLTALAAARLWLGRRQAGRGGTPSRAHSVLARSLVVTAVVALALLLAVATDTWVPRGALVVCLGMLGVLLGVALLCRRRPERYGFSDPWAFLLGLAVPLTVLAVVYLAVAILVWLGALSWLELTPDLWFFVAGASLVVSLALYAIAARLSRGGETTPRHTADRIQATGRRWFCDGFAFLCSRHPAGVGRPRYQRLLGLFAAAFVLWNVVQAPALYGNDRARDYLSSIADRFERGGAHAAARASLPAAAAGGGALRCEDGRPVNVGGGGVHFNATFAVPANSLASSEERYFVFSPEAAGECSTGAGEELPTEIRNDRRWKVFRGDCPSRLVRQIVFASGSPFPIFPPHYVTYCDGGQETRREPLVDGGYAHNVPVEAAQRLGARQVLLLHSANPWPEAELGAVRPGVKGSVAATLFAGDRFFGQMALNLGRLVPFLFERAQMNDQLSRENLLVVSLAPLPDPAWPPLFDFRRSVVETLRARAADDLQGRLARVENWDSPLRALSVTTAEAGGVTPPPG